MLAHRHTHTHTPDGPHRPVARWDDIRRGEPAGRPRIDLDLGRVWSQATLGQRRVVARVGEDQLHDDHDVCSVGDLARVGHAAQGHGRVGAHCNVGLEAAIECVVHADDADGARVRRGRLLGRLRQLCVAEKSFAAQLGPQRGDGSLELVGLRRQQRVAGGWRRGGALHGHHLGRHLICS